MSQEPEANGFRGEIFGWRAIIVQWYDERGNEDRIKNEIKKTVGTSPEVEAIKKDIRAIFGESGRIVIRPSGTEAKVRVMVEGKDAQIVHTMAQKAADTIKELASKA